MIKLNTELTGLWVGSNLGGNGKVSWLFYVELIESDDTHASLWMMHCIVQKWPGKAPKPKQIAFMDRDIQPHSSFMKDVNFVSFEIKSHTWIDDKHFIIRGNFISLVHFASDDGRIIVANSNSPYVTVYDGDQKICKIK